jgi:hypothetical protein
MMSQICQLLLLGLGDINFGGVVLCCARLCGCICIEVSLLRARDFIMYFLCRWVRAYTGDDFLSDT